MSNIDKTPSEVVDEFLKLYQQVAEFWRSVFPDKGSVSIKTARYKTLPISPDELECAFRAMAGKIDKHQWNALKPRLLEICPILEWKREGLFDYIGDAEARLEGIRLLYEFCDSIAYASSTPTALPWVVRSFTTLRESLEYPAYTPPQCIDTPKHQPAESKTTLWGIAPEKLDAVLALAVEFGVFAKEADRNAYKVGSESQEVIACFIAESAKVLSLPGRGGGTDWQIWINSIEGLPENIRTKAKKDPELSNTTLATLERLRPRLKALK